MVQLYVQVWLGGLVNETSLHLAVQTVGLLHFFQAQIFTFILCTETCLPAMIYMAIYGPLRTDAPMKRAI